VQGKHSDGLIVILQGYRLLIVTKIFLSIDQALKNANMFNDVKLFAGDFKFQIGSVYCSYLVDNISLL
jgi:hypothetical protein